MENKYYNEAIIGNKNMLATFSSKGELLRFYFPTKDYRQFINFFRTGVKVNSSDLIYLHDDINNVYKQYYEPDTNILNTEITNTYFNLKILQTDFMPLKENILVKRYIFMNESKIDLNLKFYIHSGLLSDNNNFVSCKIIDSGMLQYAHDFSFSTFAKNSKIEKHQIHGSKETIKRGEIYDKDYIGMSNDSSVCYDLGTLHPLEKQILEICILVDENKNISKMEDEIERIKKLDLKKEYTNTKTYWRKFVKAHNGLNLKQPESSYEEAIQEIYKRSILLFPLLCNPETGGMVASSEIDENFSKCGRYAYCWPRDAVFITKALDILKMEKETEKFYKVFCKSTQSKDGMWEQRFFTDGKLAPCWGYQIDETASVIYGVYEHYQIVKDIKFLKDTYKMCENAAKFLGVYLDNVLGTKDESDVVKKEIEETYHTGERNKLPVSYDLWEMHEGVHLYSLSAIYAAFEAMKQIHIVLKPTYEQNNRLKVEAMNRLEAKMIKYQEEIKKYILTNLYDEKTKTFSRNLNDNRTDISELGMIVPFALFSAKEKKVQNTIEKINMTLRTYTGGYLRFEQDHYRGGTSPWPIATLWMAMYYQKAGERKKAKECIEFVVNSANEHGLLGEQVDNQTMQPNWTIGLRMGSCYVCFGDGSH